MVMALAERMSDISFYPYQKEFLWHFIVDIIERRGSTLTALFSRQSGKSQCISSGCCALAVLLPFMAEKFPDDWRFNLTDDQGNYRGFRKGVNIGIYAPILYQAQNLLIKLRSAMVSDFTKTLFSEIGISHEVNNGENVALTNGSIIKAKGASTKTKIESATHHIVICDECQDMDETVIKKSISPMLASTLGSMVQIGTANEIKSVFWHTIKVNKSLDANEGTKKHFCYDDRVCSLHNSLYRRYVENEKKIYGEDSDYYQMSYRCRFILDRGMFLSERIVYDPEVALQVSDMSGIREDSVKIPARYHFVAGIDFARKQDETVITVIAIDWNSPEVDVDVDRPDGTVTHYTAYKRHIVGWKSLPGLSWEAQFAEIKDYLSRWSRLDRICVDATGLGDVMYDRLSSYFDNQVEVLPIVMSLNSKSDMYRFFAAEFSAKRVTFPYSETARQSKDVRKFTSQLLDLEKDHTANGVMTVHHGNSGGARDDYPDSAALAIYGTRERPGYLRKVEEHPDSFFFEKGGRYGLHKQHYQGNKATGRTAIR